ncbi:MAG: hypothetical protein ACK5ST_00340 [bacterium]
MEDVLAKIRHRYLIIGSGALRSHGIDWEEGDLDIWLDPNLSDEDWQAAVDDAAGFLKRPWKRGEPDGSGGLRASTRIACSPPLDVTREVMGCTTEAFEKAFDNSLISFLLANSLPPLEAEWTAASDYEFDSAESRTVMPDFNDPSKLSSGKEMIDRLTNLIAIFEKPALDFFKNRADGDDTGTGDMIQDESNPIGCTSYHLVVVARAQYHTQDHAQGFLAARKPAVPNSDDWMLYRKVARQ